MESLKIHSAHHKPGASVLAVFIAGAWFFVITWLLTAYFIFPNEPGWAMILVVAASAYMVYLVAESRNLIHALRHKFTLTIDTNEVSLQVDKGPTVYERTMPIDCIKTIEIYRYWDEGSLVLRGKEHSMEIPLWAFPHDQSRIVRLLQKTHAEVISVP
ncbi:MAG: hypothetical protein KIT34_16225 [Cyanobacteria bacterium TGS_CYA1]|nr:hypothetical protein [Cyanobacteria bacterium TGS_CYA1]